jgi:hypothetical protein
MPRPRHDTVGRISMVAVVFALLTKTCRPQQAFGHTRRDAQRQTRLVCTAYGISNVVRTNRNLFLFFATTGSTVRSQHGSSRCRFITALQFPLGIGPAILRGEPCAPPLLAHCGWEQRAQGQGHLGCMMIVRRRGAITSSKLTTAPCGRRGLTKFKALYNDDYLYIVALLSPAPGLPTIATFTERNSPIL